MLLRPAEVDLSNAAVTLDLRLQIAATAQHLNVDDSAGPTLSADAGSNASATVISGDALDSLSDDPDDLQADLEALAGPAAGPGGNQIIIDGFTTADLPPKSSIREVRVNQNPFSPDFDRLGLGRVEIFTKPGTDKFHGSIPYNLGTSVWNSRNPYSATKAPFLLQELETSFSGPLTRRSSFTMDFEKQNVDNSSIFNGLIVDRAIEIEPYSTITRTPQRRLMAVPHIDYQVNENNYISIRYNYTGSHISNAGLGPFDLPSRASDLVNRYDTAQLSFTSVHGSLVNETRMLVFRWHYTQMPQDPAAEIRVLGAFNGGGSGDPGDRQTDLRYELQNNTYATHGAHSWRLGFRLRGQDTNSYSRNGFTGVFTFSDIQSYFNFLLGLPGYGPSLFVQSVGNPQTSVMQAEPAAFVGDDWKLRPTLTVSLGLRYEAQNNIADHFDFAPRIGLAWAPSGKGFVIRTGFGIFYDRVALSNTLLARRNDGITQQQYVIENPGFFTTPSGPISSTAPQAIMQIEPSVRAPYLMQSVFSVERQLSKSMTLATTFSNAHGLHQLMSEYLLLPGSGPVYRLASSGLYNQNQLILNLNARVNKAVTLFSSWTLNRAFSNTDGPGTYPANPYNYAGEYGPASTDIRNRFQLGGTFDAPWHLRFSPLVTLQSGAPFNITTGTDPWNTGLFFMRPGLNGTLATPYGMLDPNPVPGEPLIGRNAGRGPGQYSVNLRVTRSWKLGTRANLSVGMSARNLLNHTNPGPIIGNITSPLFGQSNQIAGNNNGQGFSENANNRRLEAQIRVTY